jgi:hypothetical protein
MNNDYLIEIYQELISGIKYFSGKLIVKIYLEYFFIENDLDNIFIY